MVTSPDVAVNKLHGFAAILILKAYYHAERRPTQSVRSIFLLKMKFVDYQPMGQILAMGTILTLAADLAPKIFAPPNLPGHRHP